MSPIQSKLNRNILLPAGALLGLEVEKAGYEDLMTCGFHVECRKLGLVIEVKVRDETRGEARKRFFEVARAIARIESIL